MGQGRGKLLKKEIVKEQNLVRFIPVQNILQGMNRRSIAIMKNMAENKKFDDLYSLLGKESLLIQAYGNIRRNKGSLTPGITSETVDSSSLEKIQKLATKIKEGTFKFSRLRRKWIPKLKLLKPGEKQKFRPLGVPTFEDRIIQEAIRIILETIYEPVFHHYELNMGFRPNRGTHHAITQLKYNGSGYTLALEGDIEGAYDNVDHETMIKILEKRISDKKFVFLELGFKCGILDQGERIETLTGVPQGGLASPILFNIYMHEFDEYVSNELQLKIEEKNKLEKRIIKARNKEYDMVQGRISSLRRSYQNFLKKEENIWI